MAWFGPRGNCGCCAGECSCPVPDCDCDGLQKAENVLIENVPATVYMFTQAGDFGSGYENTLWTMHGFDAINGQYEAQLDQICGWRYVKYFNISWTRQSGTVATIGDCSLTSSIIGGVHKFALLIARDTLSAPWRVLATEYVSGSIAGENFFPGRGFGLGSSQGITCFESEFCNATQENPCVRTDSLTFLGRTLPAWNPSGYFLGDGGTGCLPNEEYVTTKIWPTLHRQNRRAITGWRYIVSDIPQFVDVRVSGTTVYRVEGLDGFNGTYDVARREDLDCAAGIQQFQLNLTAEPYDITTSTPCLETPVPGGTKNVLATLTIPPSQSSKRILGLVIDGVGTFGYDLSEDWDSYTCGPQTETLTESDPCLVHTGDWLTIESSALLE